MTTITGTRHEARGGRDYKVFFGIAVAMLMMLAPGTADAACPPTQADPVNTCSQGFSSQGIFGCSRNAAALSGSVGAFSATGGVYVPVADYTVELNTGTLVYQQCVLRGIVNREAESVNSAQTVKVINNAAKGCSG